MTDMIDLLTIGQLTVDDLVFPDGQTEMGTPGGNALYSALGAALFQRGSAGLLARVGTDYPSAAIDLIKERGLQLFGPRLPDSHVRSWLIYEPSSERRALSRNVLDPPISRASFGRYLTRYRALMTRFSPTVGDLPGALTGLQAVHLAPQVPSRHLSNLTALRRRFPDALISVDPSPFYFHSGAMATVRRIMAMADLVLPSREELRSLFGPGPVSHALRSLTEMGPRIAVAKLGRDGAMAFDRQTTQFWHCPADADVRVVDPTGAGDAFCGAFVARYVQHGDLAASLGDGVTAGGLAVSGVGPQGLLQARPPLTSRLAQRLPESDGPFIA